jgi:dTDP-glucose 4,6-dehydratase
MPEGWGGKRVLVTGAGGFIGSHLAERLVREGAEVTAYVRYNALRTAGWLDTVDREARPDVVFGDITDSDHVKSAVKGHDVVFHLAALIAIPYSYEAPRSYVRANLEGTLNVAQACLAHGVGRMVHTSTSEVYGTARIVPIDEEHPLQGQSPYSASKIAADKMVEAFSRSFGLGAVTVRPFNTFGPRQSVRAVIPTIVTQLLRGPRLRLGSLSPTRDLNFVSNTVDGYLLAGSATGAEGETFNFGSGNEVSIGELAERIGRILGVDPDIECEEARYRPAQSEVERLIANSSKAESILGWRPKFGLDEGLTLTCDWFGKNLDKYSGSGYAV